MSSAYRQQRSEVNSAPQPPCASPLTIAAPRVDGRRSTTAFPSPTGNQAPARRDKAAHAGRQLLTHDDRIGQARRAVSQREAVAQSFDIARMGEFEPTNHVGDCRLYENASTQITSCSIVAVREDQNGNESRRRLPSQPSLRLLVVERNRFLQRGKLPRRYRSVRHHLDCQKRQALDGWWVNYEGWRNLLIHSGSPGSKCMIASRIVR